MKHLVILSYLLAFSAGAGALLVFFFSWMKLRQALMRHYFFFLLLFTFYLALNLGRTYLITIIQITNPAVMIGSFLPYFVWYPFFIYFFPSFFHFILELPFQRWKKYFFGTLSVLIGLMAIVPFIIYRDSASIYHALRLELNSFGGLLFIAILVYILFLIIRRYRVIQNEFTKKALRRFFWLTVAFFPLFIADYNFQTLQLEKRLLPVGLFFTVFYYLIWNIMSLETAYRYFLEKMKLAASTLIQTRVVDQYQITSREKEIMILFLEGNTYQEISEKLCISVNTVKNHIYNIYQKTSVTSKTELKSLLQQ